MSYLTSNLLRWLLVSILWIGIALSPPLHAQKKPEVSVRFNIQYPNYRSFYSDPDVLGSVGPVETAGLDTIVALLNRHLPFIEFITSSSNDKITFVLVEEVLNINIRPTLTIGTQDTYGTDSFKFRHDERVIDDPELTAELFALELKLRFSEWLTTNRENLISHLFSHVKLCQSAVPVLQTREWVMPFSESDLQIARPSVLKIVTQIEELTGNSTCDFYSDHDGAVTTLALGSAHVGKLKCRVRENEINDSCLVKMAKVTIEGVYMNEFFRLNTLQD